MAASFPCTKCGLCCRFVGLYVADWPARPDGACVYLRADNTCDIYETRPMVCRIDEGRPPHIAAEEWTRLNLKACAELQQKAAENG